MNNPKNNNNIIDKNQMANNLFNSILAFQNAIKNTDLGREYSIDYEGNMYQIKLGNIQGNDNAHEIELRKEGKKYLLFSSNHNSDKYSINGFFDDIYTHLYTFDFYQNNKIIYEKDGVEDKDEKIILLTNILKKASDPKGPIYTHIGQSFAKKLAANLDIK